MENFLKIVKRAGLFNRDLRVKAIYATHKKNLDLKQKIMENWQKSLNER